MYLGSQGHFFVRGQVSSLSRSYILDNAPSHMTRPEDVLNAECMYVEEGGAALHERYGVEWRGSGNGQ